MEARQRCACGGAGAPRMLTYSVDSGKWGRVCVRCGSRTDEEAPGPVLGSVLLAAQAAQAGQNFLNAHDFGKAETEFEKAADQSGRPEYRWMQLLAEYGVTYFESERNEGTASAWVPVIWKKEPPDGLMSESDAFGKLQMSASGGDGDLFAYYDSECGKIDGCLSQIREQKEAGSAYDIFLCYKDTQTDEQGNAEATAERELLEKVYDEMHRRIKREKLPAINIFFAKESLKDTRSDDYGGVIHHALGTARLMVVVAASKEHAAAPWLRSEWERFRYWHGNDRSRRIELCCMGDMAPEYFPEEINRIQCIYHTAKADDANAVSAIASSILLEYMSMRQAQPGEAPVQTTPPTAAGVGTGSRTNRPDDRTSSSGWTGGRRKKRKKGSAVRNGLITAFLVLSISIAVTVAICTPLFDAANSRDYANACVQLSDGDFEAARAAFARLDDYEDAPARMAACGALLSLQEDRAEDALAALAQFRAQGEEASAQLSGVLADAAQNWLQCGLTPRTLLTLLGHADELGLSGRLDVPALRYAAHVALLSGTQLATRAADVDGDGSDELVVLTRGYTVEAYDMSDGGNIRTETDEGTQAALAMEFGHQLVQTDLDAAAGCYAEAYRLNPTKETYNALLEVQKQRIPVQQSGELLLVHDFTGNTYTDGLLMDASGKLSIYSYFDKDGGTYVLRSSLETGLPGAACEVLEGSEPPVLLMTSASGNELMLISTQNAKLELLLHATNVLGYHAEGTTVTYTRVLEGSIERRAEYVWTPDVEERWCTGIDWQKENYPMPQSAQTAVERYFEALRYGIAEEAALLTAQPQTPGVFTPEKLQALPEPFAYSDADCQVYLAADGRQLFEVTYAKRPVMERVRTWIAVEYQDGWKVVGAADTFAQGQSVADIDASVRLLGLNQAVSQTIAAKGGCQTYRLLVPEAGRMQLVWQSGEKNASAASHAVSMTRRSPAGEQVFSYALKPSVNWQQSRDLFVSPGVYYVTVEAKSADAAPYSLKMAFTPDGHIELEGNDTELTATPVELDTPYAGNLLSAQDVDFYAFTLREAGGVHISVETGGGGSASGAYTCSVFSAADRSRLCTLTVPGNSKLTDSGNLYLSAGTYWVRMAKGAAYLGDAYTLTVNTLRNGVMEAEPNNAPETANAIPVNENVHASFAQEGDVDCFTFTLAQDAVVQPRLMFDATDSTARTYVLTLMDRNRSELLRAGIGGKETGKAIVPVALPAGTYTVRVENPRFAMQDYTLHLIAMTVEAAEQEPNDSAASATALAVGQTRTGVLSGESDVDFYRVRFDTQTTVTLRFSFTPGTGTETAFALVIEQNGKMLKLTNISADSGGTEQRLQFAAGEYCIRVKPGAWLGAVYRIGLE